jgi:hypothetical protein
MPRRLVVLGVFVLLWSCGHNDVGENYGDLTSTASGFVLTQEEHPQGWGRSECFACHIPANLHLVNRTSLSGIDLAAIRDLVRTQGETSCASCHGLNGN